MSFERCTKMQLAKITGHGLATIAILVGFLWAIIIAENSTMRRAHEIRDEAIRALEVLRTRTQSRPATTPVRKIGPNPSSLA